MNKFTFIENGRGRMVLLIPCASISASAWLAAVYMFGRFLPSYRTAYGTSFVVFRIDPFSGYVTRWPLTSGWIRNRTRGGSTTEPQDELSYTPKNLPRPIRQVDEIGNPRLPHLDWMYLATSSAF